MMPTSMLNLWSEDIADKKNCRLCKVTSSNVTGFFLVFLQNYLPIDSQVMLKAFEMI